MKDFRTIHFKIGEESRPIVENFDHFQHSIFKEQYLNAFSEIETYLARVRSQSKNDNILNLSNQVETDNEYLNNLFAFVGERGTGKTSCMMSIANMLISKGSGQGNAIFDSYPQIREHSFQTINLVDPSYFDHSHNIISIVVAKLFKHFNQASRQMPLAPQTLESQRALIDCFSRTQEHMQCLLGSPSNDACDDLNQLVRFSASVDLKESLRELIEQYLNYFKRNETPQMLLLMVDDIDLNTQAGTTMAEQIRKYLILPNVIILFSIKLTQLGRLKWQELAGAYNELLERHQIATTAISEMVERYLTKLIPYGHRIFMPDFETYSTAPLIIEGANDSLLTEKAYPSIRQAVLELIFQKTRYLFYNSEQHTSYIVPRNLRELRTIINMLWGMADFLVYPFEHIDDQDRKEIARLQSYNKAQFRKYVFDTWTLDNLNMSDRELINDLLRIDDAALINARVLSILKQRFDFEQLKDGKDEETKELDYLLRINNAACNISIGDVLSLLSYLEKRFSEQKHQKFIFLLRTYYSMQLREYFGEKNELLKQGNRKKKEGLHTEILSNNVLQELTNFDKLVAGRFTNSRLVEFLPKERRMPSRSNRQINIKHLNILIERCVNNWDHISVVSIQLAEFFMLCTARPFNTQHKDTNAFDFYDPDFRKTTTPQHIESYNTISKNAFFDLNAFFYNITRIKECYARFPLGAQFYAKANDANTGVKSLLYQFKIATLERLFPNEAKKAADVSNFSLSAWLNWCTLRHCDILQNLNDLLINQKTKYRGVDRLMISNFFTHVATFSIPTYEYDTMLKGYKTISFKFCNIVAQLLKFENTVSTPNKQGIIRIKIGNDYLFQKIFTPATDDSEEFINIKDFVKQFKIKPINKKETFNQKLLQALAEIYPISISERIIRQRLLSAKPRLSRQEIYDIVVDVQKQLQ